MPESEDPRFPLPFSLEGGGSAVPGWNAEGAVWKCCCEQDMSGLMVQVQVTGQKDRDVIL